MDYRKYLWIILGVAFVFGGGYSFGRWGTPPKVIVTEKVVQVEKQVVVEKVKVQKVFVSNKKKAVQKHEVDRKWPNGVEEKQIDTQENVEKSTTSTETKYVDRVVEKEKVVQVDKIIDKTQVRPNWRLSVMGGYSLKAPELDLGVPRAVLGMSLERRLFGGISGGVWATTSVSAGLTLSMEF